MIICVISLIEMAFLCPVPIANFGAMLFSDTYQTIKFPSEGIFRDRGSKFLAFAYPISSEMQIKAIVTQLQAEHPKARHFCWAFRLTQDTSIFRVNDDGEPNGSAGRPILNCLLSAQLTNILIVVVRYFGGTLLGIPGLINAYKSATLEALTANTIVEQTVNDIYMISFDYVQMNAVMKILKDESIQIIKQGFEANCYLEISIRKNRINKVVDQLEKLPHLQMSYLHTQ